MLLALGLGPLAAHIGRAQVLPSDLVALRFTVNQALVSAVISCGLGAILAGALFRRTFWGRGVLIKLISAPFLLPSLAAILGLLMIFGRGGVLNTGLVWAGLPKVSIFGFWGVVLAHVFLNLPLAARMVLQGYGTIPAERFRLAQSLRLGMVARFVLITAPMLRAVLPSAFAAIFLICLGSFAVALTLGGGPRASTLELAMYQALRFEYDLDRAANLALLQLAVGLGAAVLAAMLWRPMGFGVGIDRQVAAPGSGRIGAVLDFLCITSATLFFALPMGAVVWLGLTQFPNPPVGFWPAAGRSVTIAVASASLATTGALALAWARAKGVGIWLELLAMAPLCTSALAIGTGAFLALRPYTAPQSLAIPLAILFGALLSLPFAFRILITPCREVAAAFGRLSLQVRLSPMAEVRLVLLPRLARPIGFCMGLSAALAMGDFGVIALFGAADQATLPLLIAQLLGSYQMQAAAAVTLWMVLISFGLLWIFDTWGARRAAV